MDWRENAGRSRISSQEMTPIKPRRRKPSVTTRSSSGGRRGFRVEALVPELWGDLETLFGPRGACGGCWCMTPRLTHSEYERMKGEANRQALKRLVDSGRIVGVLGYLGEEPVGWCSIEPREQIGSLARSRINKPIDDKPVWSIVCLFVNRGYRQSGLSSRLIRGAVDWARSQGARIVEAYPVEPRVNPMPPVFAYTGLASAYRRAGFREVARRSETRPIMRRALRPKRVAGDTR